MDQNSERDQQSLGKSRFIELINLYYQLPLSQQKEQFRAELNMHMGSELQRDDITLFAGQCRRSVH
jgi:serine phosphatase RsbU (regulator of sigma subunit)